MTRTPVSRRAGCRVPVLSMDLLVQQGQGGHVVREEAGFVWLECGGAFVGQALFADVNSVCIQRGLFLWPEDEGRRGEGRGGALGERGRGNGRPRGGSEGGSEGGRKKKGGKMESPIRLKSWAGLGVEPSGYAYGTFWTSSCAAPGLQSFLPMVIKLVCVCVPCLRRGHAFSLMPGASKGASTVLPSTAQ